MTKRLLILFLITILGGTVMAKDFDAAWDTYMDAYNACHPEDFISELQTELDTRMEQAAKFK